MRNVMVQRCGLLAAVALVLGVAATGAQEAPKPGPEHKKLDYFTGKWDTESEAKPNPFMPAGKYTSKDDCQWFQGGFAVVCHSEGSGAMGPMKSIGILGYSGEEKVYTYYGIDSTGMIATTVARGSVSGDTWTYSDESKMGGKLVKSRYTIKQGTATSYSFKWEMQAPGGAWTAVMEGKSTKAK